jgi:hypothetical protein
MVQVALIGRRGRIGGCAQLLFSDTLRDR